MARLQILELPEGAADDRPPFVLIIDQYEDTDVTPGITQESRLLRYQGMADQIGARAVLVFEEPIDIPANDVPLDADGHPVKIRVEPDFDQFREQVQDEIAKAQGELAAALRRRGLPATETQEDG
ncbi:hypothetical protein [Streptomyces spectabilis]|uniref:Uncharacterized protein n=1 Tax=Streptomyces spectabilis TaxID=68270 RepID=A0A5P2X7L6_STRST|nr:hypothetical protein [Streptomyces spectabilis]MBB5108298.1 hypothetical protein [Streptomyces spectabilis]MCI3901057.1 hypothetical protein [Streptomyces spectabilis]QEV58556.1 hypothetical protein CP982_07390 [Streptomyces spectabilis]GGV45709.1 hypothetical protein GCM10010245_71600 [Streptomyces spectabilis]